MGGPQSNEVSNPIPSVRAAEVLGLRRLALPLFHGSVVSVLRAASRFCLWYRSISFIRVGPMPWINRIRSEAIGRRSSGASMPALISTAAARSVNPHCANRRRSGVLIARRDFMSVSHLLVVFLRSVGKVPLSERLDALSFGTGSRWRGNALA